jgi:hypothetical protein
MHFNNFSWNLELHVLDWHIKLLTICISKNKYLIESIETGIYTVTNENAPSQ